MQRIPPQFEQLYIDLLGALQLWKRSQPYFDKDGNIELVRVSKQATCQV